MIAKKSIVILAFSALSLSSIYADTTSSKLMQSGTQKVVIVKDQDDLKADLVKLNSMLERDPILKDFKIQAMLTTDENKMPELTLSGELDTDKQYEDVVTLSENIMDINNINIDNLKVKDSESSLSDLYITGLLKGKIINNNIFNDKSVEYWGIDISTKNGVVYITGNVDNSNDIPRLEQLAKSINDVKNVKVDVKIVDQEKNDNATATATDTDTDTE